MADTALNIQEIRAKLAQAGYGPNIVSVPHNFGQTNLAAEFAQNDPRHLQTDKNSNEVVKGETAQYWAGVKGYDHTIFEDEDLTEDKLAQSASFIKAAKIIYEMEGASATEVANISNEDLTSWAIGHMRGFNMNLTNMTWNTAWLTGATTDQKTAFVYLMDAYDQKDWDGWGLVKSIGWLAADPTTYIGLATFGIGFAAKEAAKQGGKAAIRAGLKEAVKEGLEGAAKKEFARSYATKIIAKENLKLGAKIGAAEGAIYAPADDFMRQRVEHTAGRQDARWDPSRTSYAMISGAGAGIVMGGGMSWAGPTLGRFMQRHFPNLTGRFTKTADDTANKVADDAEVKVDEPEIKADEAGAETPEPETADSASKPRVRAAAQIGDQVDASNKPKNTSGSEGGETTRLREGQSFEDWVAEKPERLYWFENARGRMVELYRSQLVAGKEMPEPEIRRNTSGTQNNQTTNQNAQGADAGTTASSTAGNATGEATARTADAETGGPGNNDGGSGGGDGGDGGNNGRGGGDEPPPGDELGDAEVEEVIDGPTSGPRYALERKIVKLVTPTRTGDAVASSVEGAADLPGFKQSVDWGHWFLGRKVYKPWTLWDDYRNLRIEAFMTNPEPVIRPVVDYVDKSMEGHDILKGLHDLNQSIKASDATDITSLRTDMLGKMANFSETYGDRLQQAKAEIESLRNHVDDTFKTLKERGDGQGGNDGRYYGLVETMFTDADGVEYGHKKALLEYLDDQIKVLDDLQQPGFGDTGQRVTTLEYIPGMAIENVHALKTHSLHKIFTAVEDAHGRLHPMETTTGGQGPTLPGTNFRLISADRPTQEVNGIKIAVAREDRDALIRELSNGVYHAEPTLKKREPAGNTEVRTENMESKYKQLFDENGIKVIWSVEDTNAFAAEVAKLVITGRGHEALLTGRRLMRQVDSNIERFTIPPNLTSNANFKELIREAGIENTPYFKKWKASFDAATDRKNLTGREEEGWGPTSSAGRHSEAVAMERTYFWLFKTRFAGLKMWSKPAEVTYQNYWQNRGTVAWAYLTGGDTKYKIEDGKESTRREAVYNWWWRDKPAENASVLKDNFFARSPRWLKIPGRAMIGGLTYKPLMYPTLGATGAIATEYAYQAYTGDDDEIWIGDIGRAVGRTTLGLADGIQAATIGQFDEVPVLGTLVDWTDLGRANEFLFKAGKSKKDDKPKQPGSEDADPSSSYIQVQEDPNAQQGGLISAGLTGQGYTGQRRQSVIGVRPSGAIPAPSQIHIGAIIEPEDIVAFDTAIKQQETLLKQRQHELNQAQKAYKRADSQHGRAQDRYKTAEARNKRNSTTQTQAILEAARKSLEEKANILENAQARRNDAKTLASETAEDLKYLKQDRIDAIITLKTQGITDTDLQLSTIAILEAFHAADNSINLMDDKYAVQAQKWAAEGKEPSKRELRKFIAGSNDGADADAEEEADTGRRTRSRNQFNESAGESAKNLAKGGFNWLYGWTGADSDGSTMGRIFNVMGGLGTAVGGFWDSLTPGWKAGIGGVFAALLGTNFIKNQLGFVGKLPFMGLIIAAGIFGGAGKIFHSFMKQDGAGASQGDGKHSTRTARTSVSSSQRHNSSRAQINKTPPKEEPPEEEATQENKDPAENQPPPLLPGTLKASTHTGQHGGEHASVDLMKPDNVIQFGEGKNRRDSFLPKGLQPADTYELDAEITQQVASNEANYSAADQKVVPITLRSQPLPEGPDPNQPTFDRDVA